MCFDEIKTKFAKCKEAKHYFGYGVLEKNTGGKFFAEIFIKLCLICFLNALIKNSLT